MAIKLTERYPGKTAGVNANYPLGEARNITTPGDGTGTPFDAALVNDDQGFKQALLAAAGIVATGNPDTAVASQYLEAIQNLINAATSAVSATQLGVNQAYQNLTASRASGVTYTNATARPIFVCLSIDDSRVVASVEVTVGGIKIISLGDLYLGGLNVSFIVPPGSTYRVDTNGNPLLLWAELR